MEEVYKWLKSIDEKYPPFNLSTWTPLSVKYPDKSVKELWELVSSDKP